MTLKTPPHICLVDDDEMVRSSLRMLLEVMGMRVSTYADAAAFLDDPCTRECDVLLLDVRMPGMSGLQLQEHLNAIGSDVPVLFLSGHGDIPMAVRAMRAGALDFLEKPYNEQALLDWIDTALRRRESSRQLRLHSVRAQVLLDTLTPREREVLDAVMAGRSNKAIATQLGIALKTVEQHRSRVMTKLGARKVAELFHLVDPREGLPLDPG